MLDVKGKKILVLGLGVSGYAASKLLIQRGALVKISESSDNLDIQKRLGNLKDYSIQYEIGGHTADFCSDTEIVIVSPGIDVSSLYSMGILSKKAFVLGELELGFLFCRAPVIAISGTNGKSTTIKLIGRILSIAGKHAIVCGNIGNPLSGEVDYLTEESVAVVEVSSFQLQTIRKFKPYIAVLLNISDDHYERHSNYNKYRIEKFRIFENQSKDEWAVLNASFLDDPITRNIKSRLIFYAQEKGDIKIDINGRREVIVKEEEIGLKGKHNRDNAESAAVVAGIMGIDKEIIREGIMTFEGLDHRFERILTLRGIEFIDDSKATNIGATRCALEAIDKKVVLIAGGRDKGGDYGSILPLVKKKVKAMIVMGEAREEMKDIFSGIVPVFIACSMTEAVERSIALADEEEAVLLSPMCSSFDMFSNYKERGEVFRNEIGKQLGL